MDSRQKFLHCMQAELWGHRRITGAGNGKPGPSTKAWAEGKSAVRSRSVTGSETPVTKPVNPYCQEKPLLPCMHPYRKPTQVDGERIPRPAGEVLLRNSAKWPRNFGRRGARGTWPQ